VSDRDRLHLDELVGIAEDRHAQQRARCVVVAEGIADDLLAILLAIPVVLVPFELGYLLHEGRRRNGRLSLEGVVLYREPIPFWQFILLAVGLFLGQGSPSA
jgi:hypothetical protein